VTWRRRKGKVWVGEENPRQPGGAWHERERGTHLGASAAFWVAIGAAGRAAKLGVRRGGRNQLSITSANVPIKIDRKRGWTSAFVEKVVQARERGNTTEVADKTTSNVEKQHTGKKGLGGTPTEGWGAS